MTAVWQVIDDGGAGADERERALFADLDAVLALPFEPAGPPNRLRSVRRIAIAGRIWFLKVFTATQPKNRLRFALTRPRARNDAGRELRVTQALRAAGFAAPRPVAFGCRGATSFYLCAELAGRPLADWLATPDAGQGLADRAARFCGGLLAAGFRLPDLSPDHVFVDGERFAVLDLHNG
ncbi:MAG: hypothetical protein KDE27_01790, partial [Planctomycetes bacterium]|nr:hypothetical protein [Planctomycetota bacterium]